MRRRRRMLAVGENRQVVALGYYEASPGGRLPQIVLPEDASEADKQMARDWVRAVQARPPVAIDVEWVHPDHRS